MYNVHIFLQKGAAAAMNTIIKKTKPRYIVLKLIAVLAVIFFILSAASFPLKTVYYKISTEKVQNTVRIAQISDLHSCRYGKNMINLINALDRESPDIVVFTGDIYDDIVDNDNTKVFLKAVGKKYQCFYVSGNHEIKSGKWEQMSLEAQSYGINVPVGENVRLGDITLCGTGQSKNKDMNFLDSVKVCSDALQSDDPDRKSFSVLLAHYPEQIGYYRSFGSFDLILSGHAHGGQWRIPGLVNGIYSPNQGLFPKYAGGEYIFDDSVMIVSRGLSRTKEIIPRIFNNPELVIVDIQPEGEVNAP